MHFQFHFHFLPSLLLLLSSLLPLATSTSLTLHLASPPNLPQPNTLPPRTHATLTTSNFSQKAYLTSQSKNTITFAAIPPGSYLLEIWSRDLWFAPLRVDVRLGKEKEKKGVRRGWEPEGEVEVWQTFRGNEWDNKGERVDGGTGEVQFMVMAAGARAFFEERTGFSPLSLLSNPMILIGIVGMAVMVGMPKLMENMDPEMREEFEKTQKESSVANALTSGNPMGGFDMAAWMAGSSSGSGAGAGGEAQSSGADAQTKIQGGGGGGGGKARRRG